MLIRRLSFLLFLCVITSCVSHHKVSKSQGLAVENVRYKNSCYGRAYYGSALDRSAYDKKMCRTSRHQVSETKYLPSFVNVYVDAPVNVTLHTNQHDSKITVTGDSLDVPLIVTQVRHQTLYVTLERIDLHISKKKPHYGPINVDIDMQTIHGLTYRGKGRVVSHNMNTDYIDMWIKNRGKTSLDGQINIHKLTVVGPGDTEINGVKSEDLEVYLYGRPRVQLTGQAALSTLDIRGDAMFSFYWLRGRHLKIRAREGSPKIQLAGVVDRLDVELWGKTRFNGRYIRARQTFVKTHEHAVAEIATTSRQHTLAMDASDIYFYNLPTYLTNFMGKNGAVLDMRAPDFKRRQEHTKYNK